MVIPAGIWRRSSGHLGSRFENRLERSKSYNSVRIFLIMRDTHFFLQHEREGVILKGKDYPAKQKIQFKRFANATAYTHARTHTHTHRHTPEGPCGVHANVWVCGLCLASALGCGVSVCVLVPVCVVWVSVCVCVCLRGAGSLSLSTYYLLYLLCLLCLLGREKRERATKRE